ncbi:MAG: SpoIIE family protein phosphatase [Pontiellaceae bacterium]|nr:SpoIIE family protein phosphatase [Pontiellaceae bacterium]MBN2783287.1 SpoIIE family protein phosphatase [Pontiellaceae bacterium]
MKELPDAGYLLEQLLHGTTDVIYFKDLQSRFVLYNQACAEKHGWSTLQDGIGKSDFDLFEKEHARAAFNQEQQIMFSGTPVLGLEERETWPDGRVTWCSSSKVPLKNEQGMIVGIFGITRDITSKKVAALKTKQYIEQISAIKEILEEDARMAGQLQQNFYLTNPPVFPRGASVDESCIDFHYRFNKCSLVSGDNCYIQPISDTKVALMLCDVAAMGTRAALGAALIRGILQNLSSVADDPSAYVERLNEQLYPLLHKDSLLLRSSACYMVLDVSTGELRTANAGHPIPLLIREGEPARWLYENLVLRGPTLAVEPNAGFHTVTSRLRPGDSVILYTDSLFMVENGLGEPWCEKRLLSTTRSLAGRPMEKILPELEREALEFAGEKAFSDDVCMIGFHLRGLMEVSP